MPSFDYEAVKHGVMRPPLPSESAPDDAARVRLRLIVSIQHPLYQLAEAIDWAKFESEFGTLSGDHAEDIYNGPGTAPWVASGSMAKNS